MRKMIFGSVVLALNVFLFTGCSSSSFTKEPTPTVSLEPSASPRTEASSSPAPIPSGNPSPENSPSPSSKPPVDDKESNKNGSQQGGSSQPGEGKQQTEGGDSKGSEPANGNQPEKTPAVVEKVTVEQIKGKYAAQLTELGNFYKSQIQSIYNEAVAAQSKEQTKRELYEAYLKKAAALEEESQAKVNQALSQMKGALTENNLPTDSINELRSAYYAEVAKAKESFTAKAKSEFGLK
jgi:hypothetical protein